MFENWLINWSRKMVLYWYKSNFKSLGKALEGHNVIRALSEGIMCNWSLFECLHKGGREAIGML